VHIDLEPAPGRMLLIQEVTGGQTQALGEIRERHHRWTGDAGLKRADVRLRVVIACQLLLGEPGTAPRLPDALADSVRECGVMGRGARRGARPRHGGSVHGLASLTRPKAGPKVPALRDYLVPMGHCRRER